MFACEFSSPVNGFACPAIRKKAAMDLVRTAKTLGKHVHIGRVNTYARFKRFHDLGADTCDGSGVAMYDHMLKAIEDKINGNEATLFDGTEVPEMATN